jgi:hypothetical protein
MLTNPRIHTILAKVNENQEALTMLIANPIYDPAFKYLMENLEIAKGVISTIIDEEILHIDFQARESTIQLPSKFTFFHLLKQLAKAAADNELLEQMEMEELAQHEYETAFAPLERKIEKHEKIIEENKKTIEEKDKYISELLKKLEKKR